MKPKPVDPELICLEILTKLETKKKGSKQSMFICENCQSDVKSIVCHDKSLWCWSCHNDSKGKAGASASVHGDEIDVWIKNGICNPDGSPKRYRSREEMKRATFEAGLVQGYDTPKPNQRLLEARQEAREKNR